VKIREKYKTKQIFIILIKYTYIRVRRHTMIRKWWKSPRADLTTAPASVGRLHPSKEGVRGPGALTKTDRMTNRSDQWPSPSPPLQLLAFAAGAYYIVCWQRIARRCLRPSSIHLYVLCYTLRPGARAADAPLGQTKTLPHGIFHRVLAYILYVVYG